MLLCVHVVVKTLNLEISRCHLADYVKEFYLSACHTCSTIILPHSTNCNQTSVFWRRRCRCRRPCLSSLLQRQDLFFFDTPTKTALTMSKKKKKSKELLNKINSLIQEPPLDFLVHCDGAWGGYFCTMIREPQVQSQRQVTVDEGFVPELPLSLFVQKQLNRMKDVDTITLDPHKSGFCTYPAGAIAYRKARINDVVSSMVEADTPYYYGSVNLGNWGIEGSKPGNSAAAVYLANKVRQ